MTDQQLKEKLTKALVTVCQNENIDLVTGKKLILGNKEALNNWIESTNILLEEQPSLVDENYYLRTAKAVIKLSE